MERLAGAVAVIPAIDEAETIGSVVAELYAAAVDRVIVVDGGSCDGTAKCASEAGAEVIVEPARGYGRACLAGIRAAGPAEVILFLDGDGSDDANDAPRLVRPILDDHADIVFGARHVSRADPGALAPAARFGNALASTLIRMLYRATVSDLAPFKAVRGEALRSMEFRQLTYGWTTELTVYAARRRLRVVETPVRYRRRGGGRSKVSGTVRGSVLAGLAILGAVVAPTTMDRLLIAAKAPLPGNAKKRLAAAIGVEPAARLAEAFLADTLALGRALPQVQTGFFSPHGQREALAGRFDALVEEQQGEGLFEGLEEALDRSRRVGFRRTVLVDGDSPTLPARILADAFGSLGRADVVLGPTDDGGYYLVGARRPLPAGLLQTGAPSSEVFSATVATVRRAGLSLAVLPPWFDVDTGDDLARLRSDLARNASLAPHSAAAIAQLSAGVRA
ncbi:MAG: DUF2064 domain-containing protein [Dehalococcoidia bacterium]